LKDPIEKFQNPKFFDLGQELVTPAHLKAQCTVEGNALKAGASVSKSQMKKIVQY